jgi:hypothetical protein
LIKGRGVTIAAGFDMTPALIKWLIDEMPHGLWKIYEPLIEKKPVPYNVKVIIVVKEIECWELLAIESNLQTDSINNCKDLLLRKLAIKNKRDKPKERLAQYALKQIMKLGIEEFEKRKKFNASLEYFFRKIEEIRKKIQ